MKAMLLLVPLVVVSTGAAQAPSPADAAAGVWQQSARRDNADSYTYTRYLLVGRFLGAAPIAGRPALRVDCIPPSASGRAKFLGANLLVGTALQIKYVEPEEIRGIQFYPKIAVRYRLDDARDERQGQWPAGTDRVPTAKPSDQDSATIPKDALKRILRAHSVAIIADDAHGAPLEMHFDIADASAVKSGCNVDE